MFVYHISQLFIQFQEKNFKVSSVMTHLQKTSCAGFVPSFFQIKNSTSHQNLTCCSYLYTITLHEDIKLSNKLFQKQ